MRAEIAAFFGTIDALVGSERGVRYDDAEGGRRSVRTVAYGPAPSQVGELYLLRLGSVPDRRAD